MSVCTINRARDCSVDMEYKNRGTASCMTVTRKKKKKKRIIKSCNMILQNKESHAEGFENSIPKTLKNI